MRPYPVHRDVWVCLVTSCLATEASQRQVCRAEDSAHCFPGIWQSKEASIAATRDSRCLTHLKRYSGSCLSSSAITFRADKSLTPLFPCDRMLNVGLQRSGESLITPPFDLRLHHSVQYRAFHGVG